MPYADSNYAYVIVHVPSARCVAVDVGDAHAVRTSIEEHCAGMTLVAILCTHRHWDHALGNSEFNVAVYGSALDAASGVTQQVDDGQAIELGGMKFTCLLTPGHTCGHVAYALNHSDHDEDRVSLFTGDCLFASGVGRAFECDAVVLQRSVWRLANHTRRPKATLVWCGHEYTATNLRFAAEVEPDNVHVATRADWTRQMRLERRPTVCLNIPGSRVATVSFDNRRRAAVQSIRAHNAG